MNNEEKSYFKVFETDENFETWLNKIYISDSLKIRLSAKLILITPIENFRGIEKCFFVNTSDLFAFFKDNLPDGHKEQIDVCVEENEYQEIALHSDLVNLGTFIVKDIMLPIAINIFSNYIYEKIILKKRAKNVKLKLTVVKNKKSMRIDYDGPANFFKKSMQYFEDYNNDK